MPEFNATLVFVMVSFIVFMVVMKAIYFDPILRIQHAREQKMVNDRQSAQQFTQDFEQVQADYLANLQRARQEAHRLIQELRQNAKQQAAASLAEARGQAQVETDRQMAELSQWRETTYQNLSSERQALSRDIVAKITNGHRVTTASGS